jgi:hypothetical protein
MQAHTLAHTYVFTVTTMSAPDSTKFSEQSIDCDDFLEVLHFGYEVMQVIKSGSADIQWNIKAVEWWEVYY